MKFSRKAVDEFELNQRYFVRKNEAPGVVTGIGDDGAILQADAGRELVTVVDTLVGSVHFPIDIDAADLGYRAVAVNLSDIAAMGARPRWMTLSLTMPTADPDWLERFANGLHQAAAEHGVALIGGDTTRGNDVVVSVQITGDVEAGKAILRSGAKAGDTIYVTGTIGDAAAGLESITQGEPDAFLCSRFLRPQARVEYGQTLLGAASAAIDISDGLIGDLQKLLSASGVGAEVNLDAVPLSAELTHRFGAEAGLQFAMTGGDDYELCFTAPEGAIEEAPDLRVTAIGTVTDSGELVLKNADGIVTSDDSGYRHFQ
jgi:thiamine-monophosphate kinase